MSPLPGTRTIPAGWSVHHTAAATGGMNAWCVITDPTSSARVWDPVAEAVTTTPAGVVRYDGPCRVQALLEGRDRGVGDDPEVTRRYLVQIDQATADKTAAATGAPVGVGHRVRVTAARNDPRLLHDELTVNDVPLGSEMFTRDLLCSTTT